MFFGNTILSLIFWLLAFVLIGFLPISLFLYWLVKVHGGQGNLVRDRDIAGFFGQRPTRYWQGWIYFWSMLFATLVITVGFMLVYPAAISYLLAGMQIENPALSSLAAQLEIASRPLFFGFLGAYLFALQTITRRFLTSDLNPETYLQVASRTILAVIVAAIFSMAFPIQPEAATFGSGALTVVIYTLVFVIGIFPENGLDWILSFARRYIPSDADAKAMSYELQWLQGLNRWHAIRLNVEGIDNVHNLANADVIDLVQRTRFSVQQIFDWIDQAVLLIHLRDLEEFRSVQCLGIRGLSDFQAVYHNSETMLAVEEALKGANGVTGKQRLQLLYSTLQQTPSGDPIRLFWRYKSSYLTGAFEYFNRGRVFAELSQHPLAIEQYNLALERNPLDPVLMISRGESLRCLAQEISLTGDLKGTEERYQQAISDFTKAIELDPFSVDALLNRGKTHLLTGKYMQACTDFDRVLELVSDHIEALNQRAIAYQHLGKVELSIRDLQKAAKIERNRAETYINLANSYRLKGDLKKAEETFDQVIQIDPNVPEIYHGRGVLYASMQPQPRYEAAYQNFNRAIELNDPDPATLYKDWGETYYRQGDYLSAIVSFEEAIRHNKSYALAYNLRGLAYHAAGQPELAIKDYTYIIENINSEYADAYVNRGIALSDTAKYKEALNDLRRGIEIDPELVVAYLNRGSVYRKLVDYELAQADFNTAIRLQERQQEKNRDTYKASPVPYNSLGELNLELKKYNDAIKSFDSAIAIDPRYAEAYNNRGLARHALGQSQSGRSDLDEAIRLDPNSAVYPFNRGVIYLDLESYSEAIRDFTRAIERKPDYSEAYRHRAMAYQLDGKLDLALKDIDDALKITPSNLDLQHLREDLLQEQESAQTAPPAPLAPMAPPAQQVP